MTQPHDLSGFRCSLANADKAHPATDTCQVLDHCNSAVRPAATDESCKQTWDPLLLPDFEKRLPTLLRGIVVTRGREVRLRLDEEVKALPVLRESVLELISRAAVLVLEELVATLLRDPPVPVDVT